MTAKTLTGRHLLLITASILCLGHLSSAQDRKIPETTYASPTNKAVFYHTENLQEPVSSMMAQALSEIKAQLSKDSPMMKGLKHESCEAQVLFWQSYVWAGYELEEEIILGGTILDQDDHKKAWLLIASRKPYTIGHHRWTVSWDMTLQEPPPKKVVYDWEIFEVQELQQPGTILKWCQDKHYFERVQDIGTPLLQRWIFTDSFTRTLGRKPAPEELKILGNTLVVPQIELPLRTKK